MRGRHERPLLLSLCCGALALLAMACADGDRRTETAATARPQTPTLRVVVLTDLSGYLEPCGCQSRPLGGIDKAAAQIAGLKADGTPVLVVAAGDLFFGDVPEGASSASEAQTQETWKAETLAGIFERLGLSAAAPGAHDLVYGNELLGKLATRGSYRLLPAQPGSAAEPEAVASWSTTLRGVKVGVIGVSTFLAAGSELDPLRERALVQRVQPQVEALRREGAQWVITLVSGTQRFGRRIAGALKSVDLVVLGGLDEAEAVPPSRVGEAFVLRAGRQGQGMVTLDLFAEGSASLSASSDISEWTRKEASQAARARIDELAARIATWQRDPNVDKASVAEQQARLQAMRGELTALTQAPEPSGSRFAARHIELGPEISGDPEVRKLISAYDARVNDHNREAFADLLPKPVPPGAASYVGSERCKSCHEEANAWWAQHPHGRAYTTLVTRHKEFNLSCVACHVTGYGQPGGSTVTHNAGLTHVGCESCHGPASKHVAQPDTVPALGMTTDPSAEVCKHCHTPEHSDRFEYTSYRQRLLVPGHGLPLRAAPTGKAP